VFHKKTVVRRVLSLLCVFFVFFVRLYTDFSADFSARGVKFCMRVGLLSGQVRLNIGSRGLTGAAALFPV